MYKVFCHALLLFLLLWPQIHGPWWQHLRIRQDGGRDEYESRRQLCAIPMDSFLKLSLVTCHYVFRLPEFKSHGQLVAEEARKCIVYIWLPQEFFITKDMEVWE